MDKKLNGYLSTEDLLSYKEDDRVQGKVII